MATITPAGAIPITPQEARDAAVAAATLLSPGLTTTLPGSMIEDLASTTAGAVVLMDNAEVEAINSLVPQTALAYTLIKQGAQMGLAIKGEIAATVVVTFSGLAGVQIPKNTIVSNGAIQFATQSAIGITSAGTVSVNCVSQTPGMATIPPNTVVNIVSNFPSSYGLTCNNAAAGTQYQPAETMDEYRARVLDACNGYATSTPAYAKTQINNISGVINRLVNVTAQGDAIKIICGGSADPQSVASAIFNSVWPLNFVYSVDASRNSTNTVLDYPDSYVINYIVPRVNNLAMNINWSSNTQGITNDQLSALVIPPIVAYINSLTVSKPFSQGIATDLFYQAVDSLLPSDAISRLFFDYTINGAVVTIPPLIGSLLLFPQDSLGFPDNEAFFLTDTPNITLTRV